MHYSAAAVARHLICILAIALFYDLLNFYYCIIFQHHSLSIVIFQALFCFFVLFYIYILYFIFFTTVSYFIIVVSVSVSRAFSFWP